MKEYSFGIVPGDVVIEEITPPDNRFLRRTTKPHHHVPKINPPGLGESRLYGSSYPGEQITFDTQGVLSKLVVPLQMVMKRGADARNFGNDAFPIAYKQIKQSTRQLIP